MIEQPQSARQSAALPTDDRTAGPTKDKDDDYFGPHGIRINGRPVVNTWVGFGYPKIRGT